MLQRAVFGLLALMMSLASAPLLAQDSAFRVGAAKIDSTPGQELCTGGYGIFCGWKAADAPTMATISGSFSKSWLNTVQITWVSF